MITQKVIAMLAGCSESYLSQLVRGEKHASKPLAVKIGKMTRTAPDLWVFGKACDRKSAMKNMKGDAS